MSAFHQLVEYLVGAGVATEAAAAPARLRVAHVVGGALLVAMAALSDGALGIRPWLGRGAHRVLDVVTLALFAASPLLLRFTGEAREVIEAEAVAVLLLALTARARAQARARRRPPPPPPRAPRSTLERRARIAGRLTGKAWRAVEQRRTR